MHPLTAERIVQHRINEMHRDADLQRAIDGTRGVRSRPDLVRRLLERATAGRGAGTLRPLLAIEAEG